MLIKPITTFKRYEYKFILSAAQYTAIFKAVKRHTAADAYGNYLVQNIFFDTDNWSVIRASIEQPVYKEKLRLRCYGIPDIQSTMFLELKKKFEGIVYKRRISLPMQDLKIIAAREITAVNDSQIGRELDFYLKTHPVYERAHISYKREAFAGENSLRITFDTNIRFRIDSLDYKQPQGGHEILPEELTLMEIKTSAGIPIWLTQALSKNEIFPTSFSKYGMGYKKYVLPLTKGK